jgi:DNA-binding NtrC family response regulator
VVSGISSASAFGSEIVLVASSATATTVALRGELQRIGCEARTASTRAEFEEALFAPKPVSVVLCEPLLRDCDWRTLLRSSKRLRDTPLFVLATQSYDPLLWAELLNLGGFDLMPAPWSGESFDRVVRTAVQRWARAQEVRRAREQNGMNPAADRVA